jgi:hypothetical protein
MFVFGHASLERGTAAGRMTPSSPSVVSKKNNEAWWVVQAIHSMPSETREDLSVAISHYAKKTVVFERNSY